MSRTEFVHITDSQCAIVWTTGYRTVYWAPSAGGYVRDTTDKPGTLGQQVCDGLAGRRAEAKAGMGTREDDQRSEMALASDNIDYDAWAAEVRARVAAADEWKVVTGK